jgi:hypothetical protein
MSKKMYQYLNADADQLIEKTCKIYTKVIKEDNDEDQHIKSNAQANWTKLGRDGIRARRHGSSRL